MNKSKLIKEWGTRTKNNGILVGNALKSISSRLNK